MWKPQTVHHPNSYTTVTQSSRPCFLHLSGYNGSCSNSTATFLPVNFRKNGNYYNIHMGRRDPPRSTVKAIASTKRVTRYKVTVTVKPARGGIGTTIAKGLDDISDALFGKGLQLELVAAELDPRNGDEKATIKAVARMGNFDGEDVVYEADIDISNDFGEVGAIIVESRHNSEMFVYRIVLGSSESADPISFSCESWLSPKVKTIFFSNKSYLPSKTPNGLDKYRKEELKLRRGDGTGERKNSDRIYDYDVYNDLGNPDSSEDLARPVLGGNKSFPYPRRCRTGRPKTKKDPLSESRGSNVYVPRDEAFTPVKSVMFSVNTLSSVLRILAPSIEGAIQNRNLAFPYFTEIDSLYNEGIMLPTSVNSSIVDVLPNLIKAVWDTRNLVLMFDTPEFVDRDKFGWMRDAEFSRQTLAGLNPCNIQLVKEWPLKSALDIKVYGPAESAFTEELIERQIKGFMTLEEALEQKKLFVLDYHDLLLPYVERVRSQQGTTLYGSRALFLLTPDDTLMPVGIELTRPPMDGKPQWKEVFTPCWTPTGTWLWKLAKAHFQAHDSGLHQLVSHWLRTHCCTEPYIIASHRQLSEMHPIYRLLHPHFRYTMEINALAREALISADGIIERAFSPLKYSMELSSVAYDKLWRFDHQALPADLISRGMAEPDLNAPHGLKLTIEDYPYANDGLMLWDILKKWVSDYVTHFYPDPKSIQSDEELQAWWTEIRTVGHADKKDEPWWPVLNTPGDLVEIVTTIVWVTSGHHAAVNFGQYDFAGYFPNRPTIARTTMPTEEPTEERMDRFMRRPESELLACFPSQFQATLVMAVLRILSTHSPDEDYLGDNTEPAWVEDPVIKAAFEEFQGRLKELEGIIDEKNTDTNLKNRTGAGVVPYQFFKPSSEPGMTSQGVPYSISI